MTVDTSYLAGNPVYQGGTPQPTQGTVDPTGYVDRELNNQSNSRSGLAAAALNGTNTPTAPAPNTQPAGVVNPTRNDQGQYFHTPVTAAASGTAYTGGPVGVQVTWPDGRTANEFYTPKTQEEYNSLAQNGWKYNVTADMSGLMRDPTTAAGLDALQGSEITERNALTQAMQNRLSGITQNEGLLNQQTPQELASNRAGFGGRGMLFSSGFANSEQNLLSSIARKLAGYEQQAETTKTDTATALQKFLDAQNQRRVGLYGQQAAYDTKQLQDANIRAAIEKQLGLMEGNNVGLGQKYVAPKPVAPAKAPVRKPGLPNRRFSTNTATKKKGK